jgi:DNA modification methylase
VLQHTPTRTVVDPFCGHGSVLAVANALGLSAVGVELSPKRAKRARNLTIDLSRAHQWSPRGQTPPESGEPEPD